MINYGNDSHDTVRHISNYPVLVELCGHQSESYILSKHLALDCKTKKFLTKVVRSKNCNLRKITRVYFVYNQMLNKTYSSPSMWRQMLQRTITSSYPCEKRCLSHVTNVSIHYCHCTVKLNL